MLSNKKIIELFNRLKSRKNAWLELGYGNITFSDELDFDITELDIVYGDNDKEVSK